MSIKSDNWIRRMAAETKMIEPFEPNQVRRSGENGLISYGTSSYGYDVRCANEFKIFTNINSTIVDPKRFDEKSFVDLVADVCIIPPNSFALARTVEYFRIPRSVLTICLGKSTYARCGIIVNVTPLEPEWEGHVTLEFSNTTTLPAKIYANEGAGADALLRVRRDLQHVVQGPRRKVSGPEGRHAAEGVVALRRSRRRSGWPRSWDFVTQVADRGTQALLQGCAVEVLAIVRGPSSVVGSVSEISQARQHIPDTLLLGKSMASGPVCDTRLGLAPYQGAGILRCKPRLVS
jgi:dCTP deaminase